MKKRRTLRPWVRDAIETLQIGAGIVGTFAIGILYLIILGG